MGEQFLCVSTAQREPTIPSSWAPGQASPALRGLCTDQHTRTTTLQLNAK